MKLIGIFLVLVMAIPALAQSGCDVNGNGYSYEVGDFVLLANILSRDMGIYVCDIDCDTDGDGLNLTMADIWITFSYPFDTCHYDYIPDFGYHPEQDTLRIESSLASPGQQLILPVTLNTIDTLSTFQLYIEPDTSYITIDTFIVDQNENIHTSTDQDNFHIFYFDFGPTYMQDSICYLPGNYHLGDLLVTVNPDINQPVTTHITFGTCPDDNFYTGLANMTFFVPVLVDGVITITPVSVDDESADLPIATSTIEAYPNPFNSSVNIIVESPIQDVLSIYDVLGREIYRYEIAAGRNNINWNSIDSDNYPVNAGVYFAKLRNSSQEARKLLLIK